MLSITSFLFVFTVFSSTLKNFIKDKTELSSDEFTIYCTNLDLTKVYYAYNIDKAFSIASLNKLYTSVGAIKFLGAGYRFKTNVYALYAGSHISNLVIEGGGDPLFVSESLWVLVNKLHALGIKNIDNIIIDNSKFTPYRIGEGQRAYATSVFPLSFNFNTIAINIVSGQNPRISFSPSTNLFTIKNRLRYCSGCKTRAKVDVAGSNFIVKGLLNNTEYSFKTMYRNLVKPENLLKEQLSRYLNLVGISIRSIKFSYNGSVKKQNLLFSVESRRLEDILTDMNRFSNNFIAEMLLQKLLTETKISSIKDLETFVKKYIGLYKIKLNMLDASGMSLANKSSSRTLVYLFSRLLRDYVLGPALINSLPVAGKDGTIRTLKLPFYLRAKTGTLATVKGYAGYFVVRNRAYPFAVIANGTKALRLTKYIDDILYKLAKMF